MQLEVELEKNEMGDWVATAVAYGISATGRTEQEVLLKLFEAVTLHFRRKAHP